MFTTCASIWFGCDFLISDQQRSDRDQRSQNRSILVAYQDKISVGKKIKQEETIWTIGVNHCIPVSMQTADRQFAEACRF